MKPFNYDKYLENNILLKEMGIERPTSEISDDQIRDAAVQYDDTVMTDVSPIAHFIAGAEWYREQLKNNNI